MLDLVRLAKNAISISGAGLSVASGLPTYRGENGIWLGNDPAMLTEISLHSDPVAFWRFFRQHWAALGETQPNAAHEALVTWSTMTDVNDNGRVMGHITQNVDGLLQMAGATDVVEMHGNLRTVRCVVCERHSPMTSATGDVPRCDCGGLLRPNVVMYGDPIDGVTYDYIRGLIRKADLIMVVGTSLAVDPLAYLFDLRRADTDVICVDPNPPTLEGNVLYIREPAEIALPYLLKGD